MNDVKHKITEEDLKENPELVEAGIVAGETVTFKDLPEEDEVPAPSNDAGPTTPPPPQVLTQTEPAIAENNITSNQGSNFK
jgi:hypothetical protein